MLSSPRRHSSSVSLLNRSQAKMQLYFNGIGTFHANEILHLAREHPAQRALGSEMGRFRIELALINEDADSKCIIVVDRLGLATITFVDEMDDPWYNVSVKTKQARKYAAN